MPVYTLGTIILNFFMSEQLQLNRLRVNKILQIFVYLF